MTIGKRFGSASAVLVGLTVLLSVAGLWHIRALHRDITALEIESIPGLRQAGLIAESAKTLRIRMNSVQLDVATQNSSQAITRSEAELEQAWSALRREVQAYERTIVTEEDRALFAQLKPAIDHCEQTWIPVRATASSDPAQALAEYRRTVIPAFDALMNATHHLSEYNRTAAGQAAREASQAAEAAEFWNWVIGLLAIFTGAGLAALAVRSVNRALGQAVAELRQGSEQVAGAAQQVSGASQTLARGASDQAAALEETSASSSEIHSIATRNGENAAQAAEAVNRSSDRFAAASEALREMVAAMGEINTQSEKIGRIMKVIDEIAFQTNILALNAAVEAARAGEAGMGFAVVADEVRNLAQRCAQAASDTTDLIEGAIRKSAEGKVRVDHVADCITAISADAGKIKELVEHVHQGSAEQALGLGEVSRAVSEMQSLTQSTAAAAEQSAAAAEELSAQAETLRHTAENLTALVGANR